MKYMYKLFLTSACVLSSLFCVAMCVMAANIAEMADYYGSYLVLMPLFSLGGALLITFLATGTGKNSLEGSSSKQRIIELEKSLVNLEGAANKREEFIASFAHELKTPLTAIIGYADMLRSKDMSPKSRFTAAGYIFSEGRRLESLSLKLMDIIVAGKNDFNYKKLDAGYFIRDVAAVSVPSTGGDGLILDIRWDKAEIEIEPELFKTLIINLVDNARKASKKGQRVELYGKKEQNGYAFYVKDYGRGIPPDELGKIIEPFYMVDKSRSRSQNGAGLGLALCQRIAQLHGTTLEYDSTVGSGTTVRVLIPEAEN